MKDAPALLVVVALAALNPAQAQTFVPDEATASAIAEAVSRPMLGQALVDRIKPFTVTRDGDDWLVVSQPKLGQFSTGGAIVVRINRQSGAIIDWSTIH